MSASASAARIHSARFDVASESLVVEVSYSGCSEHSFQVRKGSCQEAFGGFCPNGQLIDLTQAQTCEAEREFRHDVRLPLSELYPHRDIVSLVAYGTGLKIHDDQGNAVVAGLQRDNKIADRYDRCLVKASKEGLSRDDAKKKCGAEIRELIIRGSGSGKKRSFGSGR
jgi:hypothetical protein